MHRVSVECKFASSVLRKLLRCRKAIWFALVAVVLQGCARDRDPGDNRFGGVNISQTSTDPNFGRTPDQPIQLGGPKGFTGPESSRLYLEHLRDATASRLEFRRVGSGPKSQDGHILDIYEVWNSGQKEKIVLYIDMYHTNVHPFDVKAPKGLFFFR